MNTVNLNQLLDNYYENYEYINNGGRDEYFKLQAVQCFQNNWNPDSADFVQMFKVAIKESSTLIDGSTMHPTSGIVALAQRPELVETIRSAFIELFDDDGGDLSKRQNKIESFMDTVNKLLDEYEPGKWSIRQDFRTVLCYLNMRYPDNNYFYKSTQSRAFMDCVEHPDFGQGQDFSLEKYYKMCDWLVEQIKERTELIKAHDDMIKESNGSMYADESLHILAFDIIYCAVTYNLYKGINIVKLPAKQKKFLEQINEIKDNIAECEQKLVELLNERSQYDEIPLEGLSVESKAFGTGIITSQSGTTFTAEFDGAEKKFAVPVSFKSGVLRMDDEIMQHISKMNELDAETKQIKGQIKELEKNLKKYIAE